MSEDFEFVGENNSKKGNEQQEAEKNPQGQSQGGKVIDEANYKIRAPREKGPTAVGRGGDPLFRRINATKEQLLESENLKEAYFEIKDGFGEYGKISLMGFKTPMGIEIPRLKIYDTNGEVIEVLTGPQAIDEISKRALAYKNTVNGYEAVPLAENAPVEEGIIGDYSGNPNDYIS